MFVAPEIADPKSIYERFARDLNRVDEI